MEARQSAVAPETFTTAVHLSISLRTKLRICSGDIGAWVSRPTEASRSYTAGCASTA
jgi:hypothetical protein